MIDHKLTNDPTKAIIPHSNFDDIFIKNFLLIQIHENDTDPLLSDIVPEFVVLKRLPHIEVYCKLNLVQETIITKQDMDALRHIDSFCSRISYPVLRVSLSKSILMIPRVLSDQQQADELRFCVNTFSRTLEKTKQGQTFSNLLQETHSKYAKATFSEMTRTIQSLYGKDQVQLEQSLSQNEYERSILESAELIEKDLFGTILIDDQHNVYSISNLDYSLDSLHLRVDYACMRSSARNRNWAKKNLSAVRYNLQTGYVREMVAPIDYDLYASDKVAMHSRVFGGDFLSLPQDQLWILPVDVQLLYQLVHIRATLTHVQNQFDYYQELRLKLNVADGFKDKMLLRTAFTHKTYVEQYQLKGTDNEHLEYLGDAVLQLVICEAIVKRMEEMAESGQCYDWSQIMHHFVSNTFIKTVSLKLNLQDLILFNKERDTILAAKLLGDVFEALIGAVYLDSGYQGARLFVLDVVFPTCHDWSTVLEQFKLPEEQISFVRSQGACKKPNINVQEFEQLKLGYEFQDKSLLLRALTCHNIARAERGVYFAPDCSLLCGCCGRFKTLGASIARLIVTEHLFLKYPHVEEGKLTLSVHAIMSRKDTCMSKGMLLSKDYCVVTGPDAVPSRIDLGNSMFALFAAVFIDSGSNLFSFRDNEPPATLVPDYLRPYQSIRSDVSTRLVRRTIIETFDKTERIHPQKIGVPPKHVLQHYTQVYYNNTKPKFESRTDDHGCHVVDVIAGGEVISTGVDPDYKVAELNAINLALVYCEERFMK
ncbi:hypothetical protein AKO1_008404 [Acrasis kona]|uniref:RNase III domain-containing protein n=1 Tax=Acrasis kona TaxID=1008807 RepID=A0AAW2YR49_9EUKA